MLVGLEIKGVLKSPKSPKQTNNSAIESNQTHSRCSGTIDDIPSLTTKQFK